MEKEIRSYGSIEFRAIPATEEGGEAKEVLCGYAARVNSESRDLGGFTEVLAQDAFKNADISDVFALYNHEMSTICPLARSNGSLTLSVDENGLYFEFPILTQQAEEVKKLVEAKVLTDCSFAFTCDSDTWTHTPDGKYIRTINNIKKVYDVTICPIGAYAAPEPTLAKRSLEELKQQEEQEAQAKIKEQEQYIADLRSQIK